LRVVGVRLAGNPSDAGIAQGECLRITTGAPLPRGADTVVIKERIRMEGDTAVIGEGEQAGSHVRPAGEEFLAGDRMAQSGRRIGTSTLALLVTAGKDLVRVVRQPRVSILTTGDELVLPGSQPDAAQIFNSNGYCLASMVGASGCLTTTFDEVGRRLPFRHLRDDPLVMGRALQEVSTQCDVIVTSGGVSAGEADHLPALADELGHVHFWKVRMRPGMPILFASIGRALLFCLPGNPVSTIATFLCFVEPALAALQGHRKAENPRVAARLAASIRKRHDRAEFVRAILEYRDDGTLWVKPVSHQGSAMMRGLADADALIVLPESLHSLEPGELVHVLPLPESYR
jgi:molybdopterin molybdotransferase